MSPPLRSRIGNRFELDPTAQLIAEALLGEGVVVAPLEKYRHEHLRICRPRNLLDEDTEALLTYAIDQLGHEYDFQQILDLARFFFPWSIIPRRWRSSLFQFRAGTETRTVCSSMIARAFMQVRYPVLPVIHPDSGGQPRFFRRNFRLFTPRDFDFSPYFEIVKYPLTSEIEGTSYRDLPWEESDIFCNAPGDCFSIKNVDSS